MSVADVKAGLIDAWTRSTGPSADDRGPGGAVLQAAEAPPRPRRGFAVGHSVHPQTGHVRLEARVTVGSDLAAARAVLREAEAQGFVDSVLKIIRTPIVYLKTHHDAADEAPAPAPEPLLGRRAEKLHIGASVAHEQGYAGSLGCFVRLEGVDAPHILSCSHVLAQLGMADPHDPVSHPGRPDQNPMSPAGRIGRLTDRYTLFSDVDNLNLDAAIASVKEGIEIAGNVVPELPCVPEAYRGRALGAPIGAAELEDMIAAGGPPAVAKIGRTTGWTEATLSALSISNLATTFNDYVLGKQRSFTFDGVHETSWVGSGDCFARAGDSGALVFTIDGLRPIGLHFAAMPLGDEPTGFIIPWERIAATLKCEFWEP